MSSILLTNPPDSCECPCNLIGYTDLQDKRCLECLKNRPKLDSNLVQKDSINNALKGKLSNCNEAKTICTDLASKQQKKIERQKKWLKWFKVGIGILVGIAITELIIILAL